VLDEQDDDDQYDQDGDEPDQPAGHGRLHGEVSAHEKAA
jgi:hypothetical protein